MTDRTKLLNELGGDRAEQSEFADVLGVYFGGAAQKSNKEIEYLTSEGGTALTLIYNGEGLLIGAKAGPALKDTDVRDLRRRVEEELLTPGPVKVRRRVLFAPVPTRGWYRYKDQFQIMPVPEDAPKPRRSVWGDHPFFLEFKYSHSSGIFISSQRWARIGRELELFCSAILSWRVRSIGQTQYHWCIELSEDKKLLPSKFRQEGYLWPGGVLELDSFSNTENLSPLAALDPNSYYTLRSISVDQALDVPSDLTVLLDAFSNLSSADRNRFLRASYWVQHAREVSSKSAEFVSLVSAIEALSSEPQSRERCKECGQLVGPGPTKLFADFVEAHLPGAAIPESERKRFYSLRSALSHGGKLLLSDHSLWGFNPKRLGEDSDTRSMWQIVQMVLHNWLIAKGQTTVASPRAAGGARANSGASHSDRRTARRAPRRGRKRMTARSRK
jgi:hypothetical protein